MPTSFKEKVSVSPNEFRWFKLYLPIPMGCCIITTINENGIVNAAPFAMCFPWNNSEEEPQLIVMMYKGWHTARNIEKTKEFVVNWPEVHLTDKIMKTGNLYPEDVNELKEANLTEIPANKVKPPRIAECAGHYECRLNRIIEMGKSGYHIIGDVVDISVNKEISEMDREERIKNIKLPIAYGGPVGKPYYFFGTPSDEVIKAPYDKV
ncbi:MAG: hypothetical protein A2W05_10030 [Candidatus Schekmanbacteria bacterium RBG_16_38_10]|uniref:Flavin reductase like domain-containing protein n=1 Tax=Candidatus Schekmanbacteria bacterium RBG_16_38_10 TaxID=1817879 RepID=A0A1F7RPZ4_9BACT|nr:MAG: hypothetical protein A2W05_10030 [Candidatus Schekmanbacteria bacterium RBG_16_38_10]